MPLRIGTTEVDKLYYGENEVDKLYLGETEIYSSEILLPPGPIRNFVNGLSRYRARDFFPLRHFFIWDPPAVTDLNGPAEEYSSVSSRQLGTSLVRSGHHSINWRGGDQTFRVYARNAAGISAARSIRILGIARPSSESAFYFTPAKPTDLIAEDITSTSLMLRWTTLLTGPVIQGQPLPDPPISIVIYMNGSQIAGNVPFTAFRTASYSYRASSYLVTGLAPNTEYRFIVRAVGNPASRVVNSDEITARTAAS